jgi:hypothetical protein
MESKDKLYFILLSGKAGAGKDTTANILRDKYGFIKHRYADSLKDVLLYAGWDGKKDLRGRKLLQRVGKAFRDWDVNFWVDKLLMKVIDDIKKGHNKFCIADVRHENELIHFKNFIYERYPYSNIIYAKIYGPELHGKIVREMDEETLNDISETGVDHIIPDVKIYNTIMGGFEFLEAQLDLLIEHIFSY